MQAWHSFLIAGGGVGLCLGCGTWAGMDAARQLGRIYFASPDWRPSRLQIVSVVEPSGVTDEAPVIAAVPATGIIPGEARWRSVGAAAYSDLDAEFDRQVDAIERGSRARVVRASAMPVEAPARPSVPPAAFTPDDESDGLADQDPVDGWVDAPNIESITG